MFEKLNAFSDRIQGVVREMVQIDKTSVSSTANRLIDRLAGQGDTLEKFGELAQMFKNKNKKLIQLKKR